MIKPINYRKCNNMFYVKTINCSKISICSCRKSDLIQENFQYCRVLVSGTA